MHALLTNVYVWSAGLLATLQSHKAVTFCDHKGCKQASSNSSTGLLPVNTDCTTEQNFLAVLPFPLHAALDPVCNAVKNPA